MATLISWMERAGAFFLFVIMAVITITTVTRYLFNWPIPDGDAISRMLLAIVVFWGFASACLHGAHIQMDLLTERLPIRWRRFAYKLSLCLVTASVGTATWAAVARVLDLRASGEVTYDVGLPLWPIYAVAVLGLVAATAVLLAMLAGILREPIAHEDAS
jgi:TRAP-type C4-dicarboxylate transport system permease small subunit